VVGDGSNGKFVAAGEAPDAWIPDLGGAVDKVLTVIGK
jgi:hypothetical protein